MTRSYSSSQTRNCSGSAQPVPRWLLAVTAKVKARHGRHKVHPTHKREGGRSPGGRPGVSHLNAGLRRLDAWLENGARSLRTASSFPAAERYPAPERGFPPALPRSTTTAKPRDPARHPTIIVWVATAATPATPARYPAPYDWCCRRRAHRRTRPGGCRQR